MTVRIGKFKCPTCGSQFQGKLSGAYFCGGALAGKPRHPPAEIVLIGSNMEVSSSHLPGPFWRGKRTGQQQPD